MRSLRSATFAMALLLGAASLAGAIGCGGAAEGTLRPVELPPVDLAAAREF